MVRISDFALVWLLNSAFCGGIGAGEFVAWLDSGKASRLVMAIVLMAFFFVSAAVIRPRAVDIGAEDE